MVLKASGHNALIIIKFSCISVGIFCLKDCSGTLQWKLCSAWSFIWLAPAAHVNDAQPVLHMWLRCAGRRAHWYCKVSVLFKGHREIGEKPSVFLARAIQCRVWEPTSKGLICASVPCNSVCQNHSSSEIFVHKLTAVCVGPVIWWQCSKWPSWLFWQERFVAKHFVIK